MSYTTGLSTAASVDSKPNEKFVDFKEEDDEIQFLVCPFAFDDEKTSDNLQF
jgi:hypothetical protein